MTDTKKGLRTMSKFSGVKHGDSGGDGVALTSMSHPKGLIRKLANAIRSGKLKLQKPVRKECA